MPSSARAKKNGGGGKYTWGSVEGMIRDVMRAQRQIERNSEFDDVTYFVCTEYDDLPSMRPTACSEDNLLFKSQMEHDPSSQKPPLLPRRSFSRSSSSSCSSCSDTPSWGSSDTHQYCSEAGMEAGASPRSPRSPRTPQRSFTPPDLERALQSRRMAGAVFCGGLPVRLKKDSGLPPLPRGVVRLILERAFPVFWVIEGFCGKVRNPYEALMEAEKLNFCNSRELKLQWRHMAEVGWLLRHNPSLRQLRLDRNNLGPKGLCLLADGLRDTRSLQLLSIVECGVTGPTEGDMRGVWALAEQLQRNTSLHYLDLSYNPLNSEGDADGVGWLAATVSSHSSLMTLRLAHCGLGCKGTACLANALGNNKVLTNLDLSHNMITGSWGKQLEGAKALAEMLKLNESLLRLDVSSNLIGDRVGERVDHCKLSPINLIASALAHNNALLHLNLRDNHIVTNQEDLLREACCHDELELLL